MSIDQMDDYTVNLADAYARDAYQKGYEQGKKDAAKHGRWIHGSSSENIRVTCSECGYKVNYFWDSWQDAKYCPNCGAKMDQDTGGDNLDGEKAK